MGVDQETHTRDRTTHGRGAASDRLRPEERHFMQAEPTA